MPYDSNHHTPRLVLPITMNFGNINPADHDPIVPRVQLYKYYILGKFLYFRFDNRNWGPKIALNQYNREWPWRVGHQDAQEAKTIFFRVRDKTFSYFMSGLSSVVSLWLMDTKSGHNYRRQYRQRRASVVAGNQRSPDTPPICIATTRFPRGPGEVPNWPDQEDRDDDPPDRLLLNRYLPFFRAYVRRPKCVKHCWRYNLQFVDEGLVDAWNQDHPNGDPQVPLFEALRTVVEIIAPKMLTHVLEIRRQRWQASKLGDAFAKTTQITMTAANVQMDVLNFDQMGGDTASRWDELVVTDADSVAGDARDLDMDHMDDTWNGCTSW